MLRGLTIFTCLLGVVLLGVFVVIQVQRDLDDDAAVPAGFEDVEGDLGDEDVDFGEPEPLVPDEPVTTLQTESELTPLASPAASATVVASPLDTPTSIDDIGPPHTDEPPRSLAPDPVAFPASRDAAGVVPATSSTTRPALDPPGGDSRPLPASFPSPPSLDPPVPLPTTGVAASDPRIATPPSGTPADGSRVIQPADTTVPPTSDPTPAADDPRVIDLPLPPALSGSPLGGPPVSVPPAASGRGPNDAPAAINPDTARPASPADASADPLVGIGTVGPQDPRGLQQPQLEITKTIPATGAIGKALIYSITIRNTGTSTADAVVLEDPIPQGARLTGTVPQAELDKGLLTWSLGTMQPGSEHKILVRVIPTRAGDLGSTATVRFAARAAAIARISGPASSSPAPSATAATVTARPITAVPARATQPATIKKAGLTLEVTAPAEAEVGDVFTLTFTMTNHTRLPHSGVVLRNVIPDELGHPAGTDLEYPLPTLAAGGSKVITLEVTARSEGQAVNRATLASGETLLARDHDTIRISTKQPLKLEQSVPARASIGVSTALKTIVSNTADTPSESTTLSQTLAPGLDFLSASGTGQFDPVNGRITWQVPPLRPGATATFSTTVRPRQIASKLTSLVRLSSGSRILATSSESMQTVGFAAPSMDISGVQALATTGRDFDITYRLANRGTAAVTGGQLRINLPKSLELIKVSGGKQAAGDKTANLVIIPKSATLDAADSQSIVITVRASSAGQHLLQSQFACDQLPQPLTRTDAITSLPAAATP